MRLRNLVIDTFKMNQLYIPRDLCGHLIGTLMSLNVLCFDRDVCSSIYVPVYPAISLESGDCLLLNWLLDNKSY